MCIISPRRVFPLSSSSAPLCPLSSHTYPYSSSPSPRATTLIISTIHLGYTTTRIPILSLIMPTSAPRPPPGLRAIRTILDLEYNLPILFSARHTVLCLKMQPRVLISTLLSPTHFAYLSCRFIAIVTRFLHHIVNHCFVVIFHTDSNFTSLYL